MVARGGGFVCSPSSGKVDPSGGLDSSGNPGRSADLDMRNGEVNVGIKSGHQGDNVLKASSAALPAGR